MPAPNPAAVSLPPLPAVTAAPAATAAPAVAAGLLALSAGHLAVDCFTAIWPVYKTIAGLDLVRAGLVATTASVLGSSLQVGFGLLADRGWARRLLIAGVLAAGAVALLPHVSSWPALFALAAITAIGSAAFHPAGTGAAGALSRRRTGVFVAVFLVGGYLGYGVSQLLFTTVYRATGGATAVLLVASVAAAAAIARFVPAPTVAPRPLRVWARDVRAVSGRLGPLFAIQVFAGAASQALIFLLPDLLQARGAPRWMVEGGGHFVYVCGAALALIPAGHASDRFGARRVLIVANLCSGVFLGLALRDGLAPAAMLPLIAMFGVCNGCNGVIAIAEGNRLMPGQTSGVSALLMGLAWCFSALAPVVAGHLADGARGGTPAGALRWLALCVPVAFAASLVLPRGPRSPRPGAPGGE